MSKKDFKGSARASVASAFLSHASQCENTIEHTQDVTQYQTQEAEHDYRQAQEVAQEGRRPIRTQGRKGKKKPRINMAFDPDIYEFIRAEAEREDKSLTQCVNDIIFEYKKTAETAYCHKHQQI